MPIVIDDKARNLAQRVMDNAAKAIDGLDALEKLEEERANGGIVFTDEMFQGTPGMRHLDAASLQSLLTTNANTIRSFMRTNNHDDKYYRVKP